MFLPSPWSSQVTGRLKITLIWIPSGSGSITGNVPTRTTVAGNVFLFCDSQKSLLTCESSSVAPRMPARTKSSDLLQDESSIALPGGTDSQDSFQRGYINGNQNNGNNSKNNKSGGCAAPRQASRTSSEDLSVSFPQDSYGAERNFYGSSSYSNSAAMLVSGHSSWQHSFVTRSSDSAAAPRRPLRTRSGEGSVILFQLQDTDVPAEIESLHDSRHSWNSCHSQAPKKPTRSSDDPSQMSINFHDSSTKIHQSPRKPVRKVSGEEKSSPSTCQTSSLRSSIQSMDDSMRSCLSKAESIMLKSLVLDDDSAPCAAGMSGYNYSQRSLFSNGPRLPTRSPSTDAIVVP